MKTPRKITPLTMAGVAREAGVSTATVSRVLNKRNTVSRDASEKVKLAAARMGYKLPLQASRRGPKPVLREPGLKHGVFAFVWTSGHAREHVPTRESMLQGVSLATRDHQIDLVVQYFDDSEAPLLPALAHGKVDGLILHGPPLSKPLTETLRVFPAVWLLYAGAHDWGDRVQPDHRGAADQVFNHLVKVCPPPFCCMTYRSHPGRFNYWTERAEAFAQQARIAGVDHVMLGQNLECGGSDRDRAAASQRLVGEFLALSPRPKALFLAMTDLGGFVADELQRHGVQIMKDVCLIAGDVETQYRPIQPSPITVDIRSVDIGYLSVGLLLSRIANPASPRMTLFVEPRLITSKT